MKAFDYPFSVNGKDYSLRYSFKARRTFEAKYGKSVPGLMNGLATPDTQTAEGLIQLFLLLLSTNHSNMTEDDVTQLIEDMGGEDEAMGLISRVIEDQVAEKADPQ